nr:hypothetical protein [Candidatus Symbiopectobacterium sp. NZEC127]
MQIEFMTEEEVSALIKKKRTAIWRLRKECGFPQPVLTYPSRYNRFEVERWLAEGGVNRQVS